MELRNKACQEGGRTLTDACTDAVGTLGTSVGTGRCLGLAKCKETAGRVTIDMHLTHLTCLETHRLILSGPRLSACSTNSHRQETGIQRASVLMQAASFSSTRLLLCKLHPLCKLHVHA